ncbi:hypothetical protein [Arthrobacter sp. JZ12]|uniref:hypothetical protein n=1 Tax=Arthrobacter sp. JZ12 TaxID=2654190 RepID=UPI002B4A9C58|nr:hypothetical protein [Arthrobacter sp. JZ12]
MEKPHKKAPAVEDNRCLAQDQAGAAVAAFEVEPDPEVEAAAEALLSEPDDVELFEELPVSTDEEADLESVR